MGQMRDTRNKDEMQEKYSESGGSVTVAFHSY